MIYKTILPDGTYRIEGFMFDCGIVANVEATIEDEEITKMDVLDIVGWDEWDEPRNIRAIDLEGYDLLEL
ncbi:hypothetical protein [Methanococcus voltae]|uniref:Uncharacterized protein n=1 Tax=Methanococcus voltae (strain ATCC BAA-1334 / A3) TaxID=456320 RepID=D7DSQ7_METV3|nr:hypothetical protein [Methanococcus voltae]MCS3901768.1 hypothetical protein [Methanococcus voltae]